MRHAGVGDDEQVISLDNGRRHISHALVGAPDDFRVCHIAASVSLDGEQVMIRESSGHKQKIRLLAINHRSDELFGGTIDDPVKRAIARIVARHGFVAGKNHLRSARQFTNKRHAIAAGVIFARRFPIFG
jgi:hypothetical protein